MECQTSNEIKTTECITSNGIRKYERFDDVINNIMKSERKGKAKADKRDEKAQAT